MTLELHNCTRSFDRTKNRFFGSKSGTENRIINRQFFQKPNRNRKPTFLVQKHCKTFFLPRKNLLYNLLFNLYFPSVRKNFSGSWWKFAPRSSFLRRSRIWHYFFDPGPGSRLTGPSKFSLKLALFLELNSHISIHMEASETPSKVFLLRIIYWIKII